MKTCLCRPSRKEEVPRLKKLWKLCFGDEDAYIDHYFDTFYRPERALVLEAEGKICSMLLTFSFAVTTAEGEKRPACYIYAFCTDPEEQGRGYGRTLLVYAEQEAEKAGFAATLMVPGEKSLFDFYISLGYEVGAALQEGTQMLCGAGNCFPRPISAEKYGIEREKWLAGISHISYDEETLNYQNRLCRSSGGGFYEVGGGIAAVEVEDETLYVKELLCGETETTLSALMSRLGCRKAEVRMPVLSGEGDRPFAVVKWLGNRLPVKWETSWLAFGFD